MKELEDVLGIVDKGLEYWEKNQEMYDINTLTHQMHKYLVQVKDCIETKQKPQARHELTAEEWVGGF